MAKKAATKKTTTKKTAVVKVARRKSPDKHAPKPTPVIDENFQPVSLQASQRALPDLGPDETGYEVQGHYASVRWSRGAGADKHMFGITCCAFARDAVGKPYLTAAGLPIEGAFSASCHKKDLLGNPNKVNEVRETALNGALREMLAHIAENVAFESIQV